MEKNAYLDAMGITRWKKAIPQADIMTVLVNPLRIKDVDSPIIGIVLNLIGVDVNHCRFAVRAEEGAKVIWDMRGKQSVASDERLVSAPINELESSVDAKRALWANMQAYMLSKEA
ncbi:hypothetical protein [uncultured Shewanella sp.]|uniref:hypothetical protein n=1 Tax=uncultured Shewanella sp. TaxID=173975 RepID=UPI002616867C|nr:hypothetical protein [uncultured Shewanella sp.]